jgi:hypothetical protein
VLLTALLPQLAGCAAPLRANDDLRRRLAQAFEMAGPSATGVLLQLLFEGRGEAEVRELAKDPDVTIAAHAAWEYHEMRKPPRGDQFDPRATPDQCAAVFGVLRDRLGWSPPLWWERAFSDISAEIDYGRPVVPEAEAARDLRLIYGTESTTVEEGAVAVKIAAAAGDILVYKLPFLCAVMKTASLLNEPRLCTAWVDDEQAFVAYYQRSYGDSFPLFRFTRHNGRGGPYGNGTALAWETTVWAEPRAFLGAPARAIEVVYRDGRVAVFGVGSFSRYLEVFDATTGKALWRFSSNFWHTDRRDLTNEEWQKLVSQFQPKT